MAPVEALALGRAKRATAGNRMQALLDQAHNDAEDDLFQEVADDTEFQAPKDVADVFMEDFADTDDEAADEENEEREAIRKDRAERKAASSKRKAFNPLAHKPVKILTPAGAPSSSYSSDDENDQGLDLGPGIDPATAAPSTLLMARRRAKREAMRQHRDQTRRAGMRASTLKTDIEANERERLAKERLAKLPRTIKTKEKKMTQDQHIAEALETEELNKEALRNWLEREEQRRELRKVVRKRVRGPRWSWVSRTVGGGGERMIGVIGEDDGEPEKGDVVQAVESDATPNKEAGPSNMPAQPAPTVPLTTATPAPSAPPVAIASPAPNEALAPNEAPAPSEPPATPAGPYTRNYLVLSNIIGGLPAELSVVLGSHVDWSNVKVIPGRNRPLKRRPTTCPFTGLPARYRHPKTMIPYANAEGYRAIETMLKHGFVWDSDLGAYLGAENERGADGVDSVPGWKEAVHGGWEKGVKRKVEQVEVSEIVPEPEVKPAKGRRGRASAARR